MKSSTKKPFLQLQCVAQPLPPNGTSQAYSISQHFLRGKVELKPPPCVSRRGLASWAPTTVSWPHLYLPCGQDSLGLGLFCDVADGGPLLANDGAHILGGHQEPQGDVHLLLFGWGPSCHRGALAGLTPRAKASSAPVLRTLCDLLIRNVGDLQGVVL